MKATTLNLSEVCALFHKGDRTVSKWIESGAIRHKRTPIGYQITPMSLFFFLCSRKVRSVAETAGTPDMMISGELTSIPKAAKAFRMESPKPLYRAMSLGELCVFDLAENETSGFRVFLCDVAAYLGADTAKPAESVKPKPSNGNGRDKKPDAVSLNGLLALAEQRIREAEAFKRDVETLIGAKEAHERVSRQLACDWSAKYYTDGTSVIDSADDLQAFIKNA